MLLPLLPSWVLLSSSCFASWYTALWREGRSHNTNECLSTLPRSPSRTESVWSTTAPQAHLSFRSLPFEPCSVDEHRLPELFSYHWTWSDQWKRKQWEEGMCFLVCPCMDVVCKVRKRQNVFKDKMWCLMIYFKLIFNAAVVGYQFVLRLKREGF